MKRTNAPNVFCFGRATDDDVGGGNAGAEVMVVIVSTNAPNVFCFGRATDDDVGGGNADAEVMVVIVRLREAGGPVFANSRSITSVAIIILVLFRGMPLRRSQLVIKQQGTRVPPLPLPPGKNVIFGFLDFNCEHSAKFGYESTIRRVKWFLT